VGRPAAPDAERCPRCDAAFGCAIARGGCWCAELTLSGELRAQLAARYEDCLCPSCLRELGRAGP